MSLKNQADSFSRFATLLHVVIKRRAAAAAPSRPGEFHPEPLTEPDVSLSTYATMTLKAEEFIRRFLLHVLPKGFVKVRHFGFLANHSRRDNVILYRRLLVASSTGLPHLAPPDLQSNEAEANTAHRCPRCTVGSMRMLEMLMPQADGIARSSTTTRVLQMDTS